MLPRVWETVIQPDWSISMHMWPIPEPSKPQWRPQSRYNLHHHRFTGGPPPSPPHNWPGGPPPGGERPPTGGGPGGAMTIVNLTRGSSRSKKSNSLGLMKKAKKLFKSTAYNGTLYL